MQTAIVGLADLSTPKRALAVASILSGTQCEQVYLVLVGAVEPRRELAHVEELKGAMRLIHGLEREAGVPLIVGYVVCGPKACQATGQSLDTTV